MLRSFMKKMGIFSAIGVAFFRTEAAYSWTSLVLGSFFFAERMPSHSQNLGSRLLSKKNMFTHHSTMWGIFCSTVRLGFTSMA